MKIYLSNIVFVFENENTNIVGKRLGNTAKLSQQFKRENQLKYMVT